MMLEEKAVPWVVVNCVFQVLTGVFQVLTGLFLREILLVVVVVVMEVVEVAVVGKL